MASEQTLIVDNARFACRDSTLMPAFVCRPPGPRSLPGILFVYEAFGLNNEMKRLAQEIAGCGYAVMIPDLFSRGNWVMCIRRLIKDLQTESGEAIDDLLAARNWLSSQTFVDSNRLGVVGLCLGGGFAMVLAKTGLFKVAAPFYGLVPQSLEGACPIVASFGERDKIMTAGAARLKSELRRREISHDVKVYPAVGHSFMNHAPNRLIDVLGQVSPVRAKYNASAAHDAMSRLQNFLALHLAAAPQQEASSDPPSGKG